MITNDGMAMIRDAISTDLSSGQAGTSSFPPDIDQTGLIFPVADTLNTISDKFKSPDVINVTHVVTTSEANGLGLSEWEILGNADAVDYNRMVRATILKAATTEITMIQNFTMVRL